jgi:AcrR family transcriptional regulator
LDGRLIKKITREANVPERKTADRKTTPKSERTKERILRAAEKLFAEHGYDGVSVRQIAAAAGVQLALLSYHFKTKEGLYRAVFHRRIEPVAAERRRQLRAVMERKDPPPRIEEVLDALARPWVEFRDARGGSHYARLIAREVGDPREAKRGIVRDMLDPIAREFIAAMERALPGRPRAEVHWGYHFFIGALLLLMLKPERPQRLSGNLCNIADGRAVTEEIVQFFSRALTSNGWKKL